MSTPPELSPSTVTSAEAASAPRAQVIARAWQRLGEAVAPLSNGTGRPLARTVKLILDPLVIRPQQNPHLAGLVLTPDAEAELSARIAAAGADLAATAEWFLVLKRARRALRIVDGNPQERYFQRCFELARFEGHPTPGDPATEQRAAAAVAEIAQADGDSLLARVREVLRDDATAGVLDARLRAAWQDRSSADSPAGPVDTAGTTEVLQTCVDGDPAPAFGALVDAHAGTTSAVSLDETGAARILGLTDRERPPMPRLGTTASKRDLPRPFDRSVYERLFAALSGGSSADLALDAEDLLDEEIARTASPWELADERSRVVMILGADASHALEPAELLRPTSAHRQLRDRWQREGYVRRVRRLPEGATGVPEHVEEDVRTVRQGYLRRLWVRLHGRELRGQQTTATDVWDTLDGVLRSVIMDQRHRLRTALRRRLEGAA